MNEKTQVSTKIPIIRTRLIGKVDRCISSAAVFHEDSGEVVYLDICEKRCPLFDKDTRSCSYTEHTCQVTCHIASKEFGIFDYTQTWECQNCGNPITNRGFLGRTLLPDVWITSGYECEKCHTKHYWIGCEKRGVGSRDFMGIFATKQIPNKETDPKILITHNRFSDIDIV
jgi:hypothetical protein